MQPDVSLSSAKHFKYLNENFPGLCRTAVCGFGGAAAALSGLIHGEAEASRVTSRTSPDNLADKEGPLSRRDTLPHEGK